MKSVCFLLVCLTLLNSFINAVPVNAYEASEITKNVTVVKTVTEIIAAIGNKPINLSMEAGGKPFLGKLSLDIGEFLIISGQSSRSTPSRVDKVQTIVLKQLGGLVSVVLEFVVGTIYQVVDLVPRLFNILTPALETTVSLLTETGSYVELDVTNVETLLLDTLDSVRKIPVTLVLKLN